MFAFTKTFLAVLAVASFARATITIDQPTIIGNTTNTISWKSSNIDADPAVFSIELINESFNSQFALANNVQTTQGSITFSLPVVAAGDGYSIQFVNIGNINDIFAKTGDFSVIQHDADTPLPTTRGSPTTPAGSTTTRRSTTSTVPTVTQSSPTIIATTPRPVSTTPAAAASSTAPSPSPSNSAVGLTPGGLLVALVVGALALAF